MGDTKAFIIHQVGLLLCSPRMIKSPCGNLFGSLVGGVSSIGGTDPHILLAAILQWRSRSASAPNLEMKSLGDACASCVWGDSYDYAGLAAFWLCFYNWFFSQGLELGFDDHSHLFFVRSLEREEEERIKVGWGKHNRCVLNGVVHSLKGRGGKVYDCCGAFLT